MFLSNRTWNLFSLLLIAAVGIGSGAANDPKITRERKGNIMPTTEIINPSVFGTKQRDSYLDASTTVKGERVWAGIPSGVVLGKKPLMCSIVDEKLIVYYGNAVEARRKKDGEILWSRECINQAEDDLRSDGFSTVDGNCFYSTISWSNEPKSRVLLPVLSKYFNLFYCWPSGKETVMVYEIGSGPSNAPGQQVDAPGFEIAVADLSLDTVALRVRDNARPIGFAVRNDRHEYFIGTAEYLLRIPSSARQVNLFSRIKFENLHRFSIDAVGNLYAVFSEKNIHYLGKYNPADKLEWHIPIAAVPASPQPPAVCPDGTVYCIVGNSLCCFKNAKTAWSCKLDVAGERALISVLRDRSILVASAATLLHISNSGKMLAAISCIFPITCRPIVDESGLCYLAGSEGVICFK